MSSIKSIQQSSSSQIDSEEETKRELQKIKKDIIKMLSLKDEP